jgi:pyruvate/2-oxoglutarate dehydrogenase complex dihydrolipoamide dehydrogenase (E3) component
LSYSSIGLSSKAVRWAARAICSAIDQVGGDRRRQAAGLWKRKFPILKTEAVAFQAKESRDKLKKNNCDLFIGTAEMIVSASTNNRTAVRVCRPSNCLELEAQYVCIATGSRAHKPEVLANGVPIQFVENKVIDSTEMSAISELPKAVAIIGGGVIAVEYATVLAELGIGVTLLCPEDGLLPFLDPDIRRRLISRMRKNHVLIVHQNIKEIMVDSSSQDNVSNSKVQVVMESDPKRPTVQRRFLVDLLLYR